jgi:hypothetical protein
MALAEATRGAAEWEGLGLLSGSRINDIATALSIFCSQYSTEHWGDLLRKELPELTDEDIEWLCGLTETIFFFWKAVSLITLSREGPCWPGGRHKAREKFKGR